MRCEIELEQKDHSRSVTGKTWEGSCVEDEGGTISDKPNHVKRHGGTPA
jgi:hypothetical protein